MDAVIRAGKLQHVVLLERPVETVSATGAPKVEWETYWRARAEIVQRTASEFLTGYGEAEAGSMIVRIRYLPGITTADRVVYQGENYNLKEVVEIGRKHGLELRVSR